jgi:hypothetical protein
VREETGVDRRRLLHSENRAAGQRARKGLFEEAMRKQDCEGSYRSVKRSWLRDFAEEISLIIEEKGQKGFYRMEVDSYERFRSHL